MFVYLADKSGESLGAVSACGGRVVQVDPLPEEVLGLLPQARRIVILGGLRDPRVHHEIGAAVGPVDHGLVVGADDVHQLRETERQQGGRHELQREPMKVRRQ